MPKDWQLLPQTEDNIVHQMLKNRGVALEDYDRFLDMQWERDTFAPGEFTQMPQAVERVFAALAAGEQIRIHGDYDADGVSGATLLFTALRDIAAKANYPFNVQAFLPDREKDGYGVAMHTVERFKGEGVNLIITVDCGIANGLELGRAHELGMSTIVCDHHQMGQVYPEHAIVLHPLAPGETYPNKTLCGTGVAFKLASGLFIEARKRGADFPAGYEKWFLDLVAVATVTDVMPLKGENRVLEHFGLKVLARTRRPGLKAIMSMSGTKPEALTTQDIGFKIGPRLNAAGRLASAEIAFRTLSAETEEAATAAAFELERLNRQRQAVFTASYEEAKEAAKEFLASHQVLVVHGETWLPGIVGLIAGRLVSDYQMPAFAFAKVGDHLVGSGRSYAGLHLVEAMNSCGEIFVKRGGHPQACGLTVDGHSNLNLFRERVNKFAVSFYGNGGPQEQLMIDAHLPLSAATPGLLETIKRCEPFGEGNRPPVFVSTQMTVLQADTVGSSAAHLRLSLTDATRISRKVIGFSFGKRLPEFPPGTLVDVAYEMGENEWNGRKELQFRLVDIRLASPLMAQAA